MTPTGCLSTAHCGGCGVYPSGTLNQATFEDAYVSFLQHLRRKYPGALIVLASSPMLTDAYPPGESCWTSEDQALRAVLSAYSKANDDPSIDVVDLHSQGTRVGEDGHPTATTHRVMAKAVEALIGKRLGW